MARQLEVESRTRALNLTVVRDAETRSAASSVRSSRIHSSQLINAYSGAIGL